uniref:Uncharacterized protein n=1 Tax=Arundo donax TaxID=35708 RepID=A0A0A9CA01_ARUDO
MARGARAESALRERGRVAGPRARMACLANAESARRYRGLSQARGRAGASDGPARGRGRGGPATGLRGLAGAEGERQTRACGRLNLARAGCSAVRGRGGNPRSSDGCSCP